MNRTSRTITTRFCLSIACCTVAFGSMAVQAQEEELDEVVVTAERRATTLQKTPVSINAMSSEVLKNAGVTNAQELQNVAPSLVAAGNRGSGDGNLNMAIRGIGQRGSRAETDRGVGLYIDNVYYAVTYGSNLQFTDLDRVEVLRGPQGTLFGRNNTGGAVRYFTKKADTSGTYGSIDVTLGEIGRTDAEAVYNVAFNDTSALRLVYAREESDGFMDWVDADGSKTGRDAMGAKENTLFRGSLRLEPSDALTVDIGITSTDSWNSGLAQDAVGFTSPNASYGQRIRDALLNETGVAMVPDDPRMVTSSKFTNLDSCLVDGDGLLATRVTPDNPANPTNKCNTPRNVDTLNAYINIEYDITEDVTFQSISGYTEVESASIYDWSMTGSYMRDERADVDFWSQEFQLGGTAMDSRLNWVTGATLFNQSAYETANVWVVNPAPALTARADRTEFRDVEVDSWGVFAQGTYSLTDQLNLTFGARYSEDQKDFVVQRSNRIDGYAVTNSATWDDTNYRLVLDYAWSDDVMTYISVSDGYKSGAFPTNINSNGCARDLYGDPAVCDDDRELISNADIEPQDPEQVDNIEIGLRAEFGGRVRLNMTAFTMDYTDLQRRSRQDDPNDPDCTGGFENGICDADYIDGAIGAEIKGMETELLVRASDSFTATANVSYIKTKITDNEGAPALSIGAPLEGAPEFNYTIGLMHDHTLSNGMTLASSLNYSHKDEYVPPFAASDQQLVEALSTVSARFTLGAADGTWQVAVGGTNLTDETISYGLNHWGGFFGGLVQEGRGAPRAFYVSGKYNFGAQ